MLCIITFKVLSYINFILYCLSFHSQYVLIFAATMYELTSHNLDCALKTLTDPKRFGQKLNIPQYQLEVMRRNNPNGKTSLD